MIEEQNLNPEHVTKLKSCACQYSGAPCLVACAGFNRCMQLVPESCVQAGRGGGLLGRGVGMLEKNDYYTTRGVDGGDCMCSRESECDDSGSRRRSRLRIVASDSLSPTSSR